MVEYEGMGRIESVQCRRGADRTAAAPSLAEMSPLANQLRCRALQPAVAQPANLTVGLSQEGLMTMTERKPAGVSFESWIDAQIRVAKENGAFDNLPGAGKPLPDSDQPFDPDWWVKQLVKREQIEGVDVLPAS